MAKLQQVKPGAFFGTQLPFTVLLAYFVFRHKLQTLKFSQDINASHKTWRHGRLYPEAGEGCSVMPYPS